MGMGGPGHGACAKMTRDAWQTKKWTGDTVSGREVTQVRKLFWNPVPDKGKVARIFVFPNIDYTARERERDSLSAVRTTKGQSVFEQTSIQEVTRYDTATEGTWSAGTEHAYQSYCMS